jgi:hypothetical protein
MEVYVTIQYVENAVAGDDAMPCGKLELTPWLRLQPVNGFQDSDELVILAIARIDAAGNLALLRAREAGMAQGRQLVDQSVHELQVRMPTEVGGGVADVTTGTLGPSAAGGLRIAVPRAGDRIAFEAANAGNFAVLDVRADRLVLAGDLVTPGRVDGRDVSGDGQKLDSHIAIVAGNPHGTSAAQVGALSIQGGTLFGSLNLNSALTKSNAAGQQVVLLTDSSNQGGFFQTNTAAGQPAVRLTTSSGSQAGYQALYNAAGQETITLSAFAGGFIQTRNAANKPAVRLTTGGDAGYLNIYNGAGQEIVRLTDAASAGFLETRTAANAPAIRLTTTGGSQAGYLAAFNPSGNETITLSAFSSGFIQTRNAANKPAVRLTTAGESGYLNTFNGAGQEIVRISTTSNGGYLSTFNAAGKEVVQLTIGGDSGYIRVNNGAGQAASVVATTTEGSGFIETQTKSLKPGVRLTTVGGGDNGSVKVYGADGNVKLWLDGTGSKNFVMPHPEDPSKDIIYAALEGPEAAAYLRGRARLSSGYCAIQFPDHFRLVVLPESLTFQLTPRAACSQGLALTEHSAEGFIVRELGNGVGDYEFDYFVAGVRRGLDHFSPVVPRGHSAFGSPSEDAPSEPSSSPQSLTPAVASVQADEITLDDSPASSPDSVEPPASPDSPLTEPSVAPTPEADAANARLPAADTPFQQPRDPDCGCVSRAPAPSPSQENDGDQGEEEGGPFLRERAFLEQRVMVLRPHSERPRSRGPSIEAMTESAVDVRAGELLAERDALLESAQEAGERLGLEAAPRLAGGESPRMPVSAKFRQRTVDEYRERKRAAMIQSLPTADMAESVQPPEAPREAPANNWIPIGPSVVRQGQGANRPAVSGRVAGLAVAPGGQRVYAASANGGVWRSDNAGLDLAFDDGRVGP